MRSMCREERGVFLLQYPYFDKIDLKTKAIMKIKEGHYITIKGSIREDDIILINIYIHNMKVKVN